MYAKRFEFFLAIVCLCGIVGCGGDSGDSDDGSASDGAGLADSPKNVLFIILDAASAQRMSLYGFESPNTPFLESIASRSVLFTAAYSQGTMTPPSVWSYLNGKYPYLVKDLATYHQMSDDDVSMARMFQDAGFATGGFSENPFVSEEFGFNQGFEEFRFRYYRPVYEADAAADATKTTEQRFFDSYRQYFRAGDVTGRLVREAQLWMNIQWERPWFCYLHLLHPHNPYFTDEPYLSQFVDAEPPLGETLQKYVKDVEFLATVNVQTRRIAGEKDSDAVSPGDLAILEQLYDAQMAYTDDVLRELFEYLDSSGLADDTLVVIASDHGESFGEHGRLLHGTEPYEELIRVPLMFVPPAGVRWETGSVDTPVELVDLLPTFVEIFELGAGEELDGRSLVAALENGSIGSMGYLISESMVMNALAVVEGKLKLLVQLNAERSGAIGLRLYDLATDPLEMNDVAADRTADVERLLAYTGDYLAGQRTGTAASLSGVDGDNVEALKSLGYVGEDGAGEP